MADPISVVVSDAHAELRELVAFQLGLDPGIVVVGQAGSGWAAVELAKELRPEILLIDLVMPDLDGLEVISRIRAAGGPETSIIVVSSYTHDAMAERVLEQGASAYLEKGSDSRELRMAVHRVARHRATHQSGVRPRFDLRLAHSFTQVGPDSSR